MCDLLTTMLIDDHVSMEEPRALTRTRIMNALRNTSVTSDDSVSDAQLESLKESWGRTPEAIAQQENLPDWLV